jgi:hypothetical protein
MREDINAWQIFISYFGFGKLAHQNIRLTAVSNYLHDEYGPRLKQLAADTPEYATIHGIASRLLVYKKSGSEIPQLWIALSNEAKSFLFHRLHEHTHINWKSHKSVDLKMKSLREQFLPFTSKTTVGHLMKLAALVERRNFEPKVYAGWCHKENTHCYRALPYQQTAPFDTVHFVAIVSESYVDNSAFSCGYRAGFSAGMQHRGF